MNLFRTILCAALAAGTLAGCASGKGTFSTELLDEGVGLKLTADGAIKGTAAGTSIDVAEGEHVSVSADVTSGGVQLVMTESGNDQAAVDYVYDSVGSEVEYDLTPGTYNIMFSAAKNKTTGIVTVKVIPAETAPAAESDGQNPIMNFVGTYAKDRCYIEVSAADSDNGAAFHINWGSSASEHSEWDMSGTFDTETLTVNYDNAVRKNIVFNEDGSVASETTVYENGKGSFTFSEGDLTLVWNDEQEHAADDTVFGWVN